MDERELALKMLRWEELMREAAQVGEEISAAVLAMGKTRTVGNVRATYNSGRRVFGYKEAVEQSGLAPGDPDLEPYTVVDTDWEAAAKEVYSYDQLVPFQSLRVDFTAAAKGLGLEVPVLSQSEPSVTIRLSE